MNIATEQPKISTHVKKISKKGFSRNLAFIVGINSYSNGISSLKTPVNDAKKLVEILREKHGYQVWVCLDKVATLDNLNQLLEKTLPEQVTENDRLLFYFAGHGVALNNDDEPAGYLIPQDAIQGDTDSYLPMTKLHDALSKLNCRHFLGILDCCFSGAFRWSSTRDLIRSPKVIHKERYDRFITDPAWQIITSSASDQKALDNFKLDTERGQVGNHSPFAAALLEALEGEADIYPPAKNNRKAGDGVITATELYLYLRDRVEIPTEKYRLRQTPGIWCLNKHDKGEYIFLAPGHELNLPPAPPLDKSKNPYRGLKSFEEKHSKLFFGRSELVEKLQYFVKTHPLTVVLGASGSGKSSLVKAGLIPNLKKQTKEETTDKWSILSPIRPGETPFQALNHALVDAKLPKVELQQQTLSESVNLWTKNNPNCKLLIVIDQSEELITLCQNENERQEFFQQILKAINHHRHQLRVILTLRSDFEPQVRDAGLKFVCEELKLGNTFLTKRWQSGRFIVPAMTRGELREAIEKPAETRVMYFQPHDLVEELIYEVDNMPGALPLLSFALSELFLKYLKRQRDAQYAGITIDRALTQADYDELGGVMRSLTQRADEEYQKLVKENPAYEQVICHVMLRMVALTGGELARRRVPLSELEYPPDKNILVKEVIERFTAARLLVKGEDSEGNLYVEPAHDALVRGWEKLQTWLTQEKNLSLQRRLTPSAFEWNNRRQIRFLWNTNPYLNVLDKEILNSGDNNWLNQVETEFVRQSIKRKLKNRITRWSLVSGAFILLSSATGFAINFAIDAQNRFLEASSTSAESMFNSGEELDALVKATETGEALKNTPTFVVNEKNRIQVIDTLRKIVYGITESNRLLTNDTAVVSVSYSPDGQMLASINKDGTIRLWQNNGKLIKEFSANQTNDKDDSFSINFSADGHNLISASQRQGIKIWQRQADGSFALHKSIPDKDGIMTFSLNPKSQIIVTSSLGNQNIIKVRNWNGKLLKTFSGHTDRINDFDFSPDGQILVSGSAGGSVKLWDLKNNRQLTTIQAKINDVFAVRFVNNKILAIAGSDGSIKLWNINGKLKQEFKERHSDDITSLAVSHDGKRLASGSEDATVKLWSIEDRNLLHTFNGHQGAVNEVSFRKDNKVIVSASKDRTVKIWQYNNEIPILKGVSPSVSSDSQIIVTAEDRFINIWQSNGNLNKFKLKKNILASHKENINKVSVSSDGKVIASGSTDGNLKTWDLDGKFKANFIGHQKSITSLSFSHNNKMIASGSLDKTIKLWNLEGKLLRSFDSGSEVTGVYFSPNGKTIASANRDKTVKLWRLDGTLIKSFQGHTEAVLDVSFSPNGKMIASASEDGYIRLWHLNGKPLNVFLAHQDRVSKVKFKPANDNILVSSGDPDQTIKLWRLDGELLYTFNTYDDVKDISFSPDGKTMLWTNYDNTVVWNLDLDNLLKSSCSWLTDFVHQDNNSRLLSHSNNTKLCNRFLSPKIISSKSSINLMS